jgi:ATP-binding cassette subfamily C (CFTR/MRP) protein 1
LSESIRAVILLGAQIIGSLILMCIATPFFIVPLLPSLYIYWYIQKNFRRSSREVKRMDSTTRSPLFAHFSETLTGLSTIRAYHREDVFIKGNHDRLDGNVRAYYLTILMQRWIGLRLETLASAIVFFSAAVIVFTKWHANIYTDTLCSLLHTPPPV